MWQKLSLRARINLLLALVLALGLAANIARLVLEAGPRVRAACSRWLEASNFDADGRQKARLGART